MSTWQLLTCCTSIRTDTNNEIVVSAINSNAGEAGPAPTANNGGTEAQRRAEQKQRVEQQVKRFRAAARGGKDCTFVRTASGHRALGKLWLSDDARRLLLGPSKESALPVRCANITNVLTFGNPGTRMGSFEFLISCLSRDERERLVIVEFLAEGGALESIGIVVHGGSNGAAAAEETSNALQVLKFCDPKGN
uniref:Uncharacterized protein n=1 Tax=Chromera velia CCMP2878 TaxID=1169474 RepID=A0A0G4HF57_9ALVE|mmetsp:Transcript_45887/g.90402  ORF Transcript_45887/g.90402 Transcript_45887/m.90402 type:complete len:193 (-) Transcript_45887:137-715(-)|eukprot:Cvel_26849.t1-p1 / transcript=Cvel_26849.t1 / gene=Cvel_26849 / organism=Chromera_velia_CCMP2878 / gene_product=hypothetical protein / transcript_product=hypothetical protein / location=Cvel_scaffold3254:2147-5465(+) / protein_length=192 / sequence_SO=supercontig / SO=protein_coding / is_pseudo=false